MVVKPRTLVLTNNQWCSKRKKSGGDGVTNCCVMRRMYGLIDLKIATLQRFK